MKKEPTKPYIFWMIGATATVLGLLMGFLISYTNIIEEFTIYKQEGRDNSAYIASLRKEHVLANIGHVEVLRKEVKANAENKMSKTRAWAEIKSIDSRIEYLEHHLEKTP